MDTHAELPFVSVIIPTYKDWERLQVCITALNKQTYDRNRFEVIVVNNYPNDNSVAQLADAGILVINESTPGSYAARNAGLRLAKGAILGFTDSDCVPDHNWIKSAVAFLQTEPAYDRVSGPINLFPAKEKATWVEFYDIFFAFNQRNSVSRGFAVTAHMFSKKKVFEAIGFFDSSLQSGGDAAWGKLADQHGFKIGFCESSIIYHPARNSLAELVKKEKRVGLGLGKLYHSGSTLKDKLHLIWYALKPKLNNIKYIFSKESEATFTDRLILCFLRYYLVMVRTFTVIRNS